MSRSVPGIPTFARVSVWTAYTVPSSVAPCVFTASCPLRVGILRVQALALALAWAASPWWLSGVVRPSPLQIPLLGTTLLASLPDAVVLLLAPVFPMVLLGLPIWCLLPWLLSRRFLARISTVTPLYM